MKNTNELQVKRNPGPQVEHISDFDTLVTESYNNYAEGDLIDDPALWDHYNNLKICVQTLPSPIRDEILSAAGKLAAYQEHRAFQAGFQAGLSVKNDR